MKYLKLYENFKSNDMFITPDEFWSKYWKTLKYSQKYKEQEKFLKIKDKDLELIVSQETHETYEGGYVNALIKYPPFEIYRTKEGKYIFTFDNKVLDYVEQRNNLTNKIWPKYFLGYTDETDCYNFLQAMKELIAKMQSYKFQKEYITKHPERMVELKPFGIHKKIKQEYPALSRGVEWGFFDLERSER